ncbi:T9SS type A sorting domain-containing protein [Maribellus mangrovi]|uniref:T9SS type A sorting domain-containing protein n=1 Tax=Maribellus mangrovi TaxID=3133146 RepID=UPI0030EE2121
MKRILLLIVTISLFSVLQAQENTWNVYLRGQAVKSVAFENDSIWALTDSFLVRLDKNDSGTTRYPYLEIPELAENTFYNLKISNKGTKWISFGNIIPDVNRLYSFDEGEWKKYNLPYDFWVPSSIETDKNSCLWLTSAGLGKSYIYKYDGAHFKKYTSDNSGMAYNYVYAVTSDLSGNIWFGNTYRNRIDYGGSLPDMSLMKYDGEAWSSFPGPSCYYAKVVFDNSDHLYIQGYIYKSTNELFKWNLEDNSWTEYLSLNETFSLQAIDGQNKIWFTIGSKGIAHFNGMDWTYYTTSNSSLPSNNVNQIAIDADGTKWIATENGLASLKLAAAVSSELSTEQKSFSFYPNPAHDFISLKIPSDFQSSTVDIINLNGQVLLTFNINNKLNRLDVSKIPAGVYLLRIQWQDNQSLKKFVKQ